MDRFSGSKTDFRWSILVTLSLSQFLSLFYGSLDGVSGVWFFEFSICIDIVLTVTLALMWCSLSFNDDLSSTLMTVMIMSGFIMTVNITINET